MIIEWNETFSVGVQLFDDQHKKLFAMVNGLEEGMKNGDDHAAIEEVLNRLVEYTVTHFTEEEREMRERGYPGYEDHLEEHQDLLSEVGDFKSSFDIGVGDVSSDMMILELMGFLGNWLTNHINGTDKKYTTFFNDQGLN